MKKLFLLISLSMVLGAAIQAEMLKVSNHDEPDCGFVQNIYGSRVAWKNLPVSLQIDENFPKDKLKNLDAAIAHWEQAFGKKIFVIVNYQSSGEPKQDGANVIYWMRTWEHNKKSEQGRTPIYWLGSEMKEADVLINAQDYDFGGNAPGKPKVDLTSLFVHELGHVLGLKHRNDLNSVMDPYLTSNTVRVNIPNVDVKSLMCEYKI